MPQVLKNVGVQRKIPFKELPKLQEALKDWESKLKDSGRILLRYSGTENLARVMVEGRDEIQVEQCCDDLVKVLEKEIGAGK